MLKQALANRTLWLKTAAAFGLLSVETSVRTISGHLTRCSRLRAAEC
ncbi:hypothetical protein HMPREF9120_02834 [Neisseria sp. oral taxon 020 str. F0370]|nr:hypothetical protein HMPREF9120_02834 [Neisseria sp. oral taxon 020 str. F0370]